MDAILNANMIKNKLYIYQSLVNKEVPDFKIIKN